MKISDMYKYWLGVVYLIDIISVVGVYLFILLEIKVFLEFLLIDWREMWKEIECREWFGMRIIG